MKRRPSSPFLFLIPALLLAGVVPSQGESPSPILVELFTSQGCSSCPPADELLHDWGQEAFERGEIVPLAFHVDYWDYIGWKDPFADPDYTRRQRLYASAFDLRSLYTPQMIVDGRREFVGSDGRKARASVRQESRQRPPIPFSLKKEGDQLRIAALPAAGTDRSSAQVYLALFENNLRTAIQRGENRGQHLEESFVVRRLKKLGGWTPDFSTVLPLELSSQWQASHMGAVVFVQDPQTMAILGVSLLYPL